MTMKIPQWLQSFWDFWDWLDNEANPEVHRRISDWLCEQVYNLSDFLEQYKILWIVLLGIIFVIIGIREIIKDLNFTKKIKEQEKEWDREETDEQK